MFDIGFTELLLVAVVALVVLGPERLPKAARFAGLWVRRARAQWDSVKQELERELEADELKRNLRNVQDSLRDAEQQLRDSSQQASEQGRALKAELERDIDVRSVTDTAPAPAAAPAPGPGAVDVDVDVDGRADHPTPAPADKERQP